MIVQIPYNKESFAFCEKNLPQHALSTYCDKPKFIRIWLDDWGWRTSNNQNAYSMIPNAFATELDVLEQLFLLPTYESRVAYIKDTLTNT